MSVPLRVALVTHNVTKGDGQGRVNYEIARYGLARGAEVTLVTDRVAPELLAAGAKWLPVHPQVQHPVLLKVLDFTRKANRVVKKHSSQFDIVCANGYVLSIPHDVNCVHFVHTSWLRSPYRVSRMGKQFYVCYQNFYTRLNSFLERIAFAKARKLVAVSDLVAEELAAMGIPAAKTATIRNGVDVGEFHPGAADRFAFALPQDRLIGLFVGDIRSSIKNLDTVLKALKSIEDIDLAVAGGTENSCYPKLARQLGVENRVHFLGFCRNIPELMRAVDFFVFPSRSDTFGLVVTEAMASGLPVITAATVGSANLITSECGRVLSDPNDVEGLAGFLSELAADSQLRISMGLTARAIAERNTWEHMAEKYWDLFQRRS